MGANPLNTICFDKVSEDTQYDSVYVEIRFPIIAL